MNMWGKSLLKRVLDIQRHIREGSKGMDRTVHYRQGFGALRHKPTLQEVWNKTVGLEQEERLSNGKGRKAYNKIDCVTNCCR